MNPKELLAAALAKQTALLKGAQDAKRVLTAEETTAFADAQATIDGCKVMIAAQAQVDATNTLVNTPVNVVPSTVIPGKDHDGERPFKNLSEQLKSIQNHARTGAADERLLKVQNASGATAGSGADGGFAIQKDFAGSMMDSAVKDDPILSLVDSYPVSAKADRVGWDELAETDISTTVFGGIQTYWASEAGTVAATKPQMQARELKLEKLMGFYYNTQELENDSTFNSAIITRGFTTSIRRNLAAAIIGGDGIGKPIGMLNGAGLVSVAKEANQTADTVAWDNIKKMYNRALGVKSDFVWLCHPDLHDQFDSLDVLIGTGGVPVYLQAAAAGSVDMLRGRPIIDSDLCSALGDKGDIMFVNPKDYLLIYKGGIESASSIHVGFLTAENCFRFIFRVNGMPKRNAALTIKNSTLKRSSIVTLDAR